VGNFCIIDGRSGVSRISGRPHPGQGPSDMLIMRKGGFFFLSFLFSSLKIKVHICWKCKYYIIALFAWIRYWRYYKLLCCKSLYLSIAQGGMILVMS